MRYSSQYTRQCRHCCVWCILTHTYTHTCARAALLFCALRMCYTIPYRGIVVLCELRCSDAKWGTTANHRLHNAESRCAAPANNMLLVVFGHKAIGVGNGDGGGGNHQQQQHHQQTKSPKLGGDSVLNKHYRIYRVRECVYYIVLQCNVCAFREAGTSGHIVHTHTHSNELNACVCVDLVMRCTTAWLSGRRGLFSGALAQIPRPPFRQHQPN